MDSRNTTIDIAKGLSILLVILGHSPWILAHAQALRILSSFHVPLFFVLAGVFLRPADSCREIWRSKADALLKPYVVVMTVAGCVEAIWLQASPLPFIGSMVYASGPVLEARWCPLWFLPHMFLALVAAHAMLRLATARRWPAWVTAIGVLVMMDVGVRMLPTLRRGFAPLLPNETTVHPGLPFSADLLPITAGFVMAGYLLSGRIKAFRAQPLWLGLSLLIVVFSLHARYAETMMLYSRRYDAFITVTLESAAGIYLAIACASVLARVAVTARTLTVCGQGSLFLLLFHSPVQDRVLAALGPAMNGHPGFADLGFALAYVSAIVLPLVLLRLVERRTWLPFLLLPQKRRTDRSPASAAL